MPPIFGLTSKESNFPFHQSLNIGQMFNNTCVVSQIFQYLLWFEWNRTNDCIDL